jgi:hypothetical protein
MCITVFSFKNSRAVAAGLVVQQRFAARYNAKN